MTPPGAPGHPPPKKTPAPGPLPSVDDLLRGGSGAPDPDFIHFYPGEGLVPPYPGKAIYGPSYRPLAKQPTIPPAAPLSAAQAADKKYVLRRIANAYFGITEQRKYRSPWRTSFRRRAAALELARQLLEIGASPEAWLSWRSETWAEGNNSPMPLNYALGCVVGYQLDNFDRSTYQCSVRKPVQTKTERPMWELHGGMLRTLRVEQPRTPEAVEAVIARHFPGGYDSWAARARREAPEVQARIDAMVASGAWLWGSRRDLAALGIVE